MGRLAFHLLVAAALVAPCAALAEARTVFVATSAEYAAAAVSLRAGDTIVLKNGVWHDFDLNVEGQGTASAPITVRAETPGQVILSGRSALRLGGDYLTVSGLVFRDGASPRDEVIAFRSGKRVANHSRVSQTVIDRFNKPRTHGAENDIWVALFGRDNRFDHNHVEGKITPGVTLAVRIEGEDSRPNRHHIDHNYFGPRPPLGANGGETIRIGTSHNSLSDSLTVVEANVFEGCSGEVEIISVKSGGNVIRGNLFHRSQGTVTLRHGNGNLVEGNLFIGGGEANTGGVRVINADQTVRHNVFVGLKGTGFASAFTMMNGVPNSVLNRYHQVKNADIHHNTFVSVSALLFGGGADAERTLPPIGSRFHDNLIVGAPSVEALSDLSGIEFSGNVAGDRIDLPGFAVGKVRAKFGGLTPPHIEAPAGVGAPRDLKIVRREETGVAWYTKLDPEVKTARRTVQVASDAALAAAVELAQPGDVLTLAPGRYETDILTVRAPLTVRGPATLSGRFVLTGGGDLTLEDVSLTGAAPLIRVDPSDSGHNYRLALTRVTVEGGGPVVTAASGAFLASIDITDSRFAGLSAPVIDLGGDGALTGAYAVETVTVRGSQFTGFDGPASKPVLNIVRGGRDESTFGPRVTLEGNRFARVATPAHLHGATALTLSQNTFDNSGAVILIREAGAPRVLLDGQAVTTSDAARHFDYITQK
ncbi:chondroitinase-B domain-containing protein [Asticcacaulis sp. W401b]|uniref:chondroitinase-B domain-containing protein n=1 Tax=Asticcacaulis sp. W401b TaxID=3388666 RepID=UPI003970F92E